MVISPLELLFSSFMCCRIVAISDWRSCITWLGLGGRLPRNFLGLKLSSSSSADDFCCRALTSFCSSFNWFNIRSVVGKLFWCALALRVATSRFNPKKAASTREMKLWKSASEVAPLEIWAKTSLRNSRRLFTWVSVTGFSVVPMLFEYSIPKHNAVQSHSSVLPLIIMLSNFAFLFLLLLGSCFSKSCPFWIVSFHFPKVDWNLLSHSCLNTQRNPSVITLAVISQTRKKFKFSSE